MIAMIFEFWMNTDDADVANDYAATSAGLRELLSDFDGFAGVERFQSSTDPDKYVALGFFADEEAVTRWRTTAQHRQAQELGRSRYFTGYRLRMADITRDYGPDDRSQAPNDSNAHHNQKHNQGHHQDV